ncbi:MAG: hypothetical protein UT53_C0008G0002 [Candidatus Yanofskybacteria bacterium GW2011_GWD2_39_48]|uniref:Uncharacterized protein n=1 Tax=Candidatus Yanofskybacteria bacterium GW2011_GWD2_39_48 TaxID=1619031 RepID=A0A0G0SDK7_9BACT|nr:MAG: hypothetical protein UT53_C0008G0002 [Candidatus Yanofskybacteria bacterium GW2011_GWD2_39_48]
MSRNNNIEWVEKVIDGFTRENPTSPLTREQILYIKALASSDGMNTRELTAQEIELVRGAFLKRANQSSENDSEVGDLLNEN